MGRHLVRYLASEGWRVSALSRGRPGPVGDGAARWLQADLRDGQALESVLEQMKPQVIFHLAARSSVSRSWTEGEATLETNTLGTLALLEAMVRVQSQALLVSVGSAEEYGPKPGPPRPLAETEPTEPVSPYGISKVAQASLVLAYWRRYGIRAIHVRLFNLLGPGQSEGFVAADFGSRIIRLLQSGEAPGRLRVGRLEYVRDFLDVRDAVRALAAVAERGRPGEIYNIGRGRGRTIGELLAAFCDSAGVRPELLRDGGLERPWDVPWQVAAVDKIRTECGWTATVPLGVSVATVLDDWRRRLRSVTF
ncbi:MAG: NAD-dependent epimerase/dehydratase family protein [Clostridia bacterium]|nr:NAD-dependent epimerase/dehydratase family protein [Clostridia bacterium]